METCQYCGTEYGVVQGTNEALPPFSLHNADECRKRLLVKNTNIVLALLPAARLVWEQGGWSGTSGNWPLVEAFGRLETLKDTAPEVFAKIIEQLPMKEYTDEPCTLCNGTGKSPGKTIGEIEGDGFAQGKNMAEFIYERQLSGVRTFLEEMRNCFTHDPLGRDLITAQLAKLMDDPPNPCTCARIQAKDPRRHFKGCPERKPLDKETIEQLETAPAVHCKEPGWCNGGDDCGCACNGCTGMRIALAERELSEGKSKPLAEAFPPKEHPTKPEGPTR